MKTDRPTYEQAIAAAERVRDVAASGEVMGMYLVLDRATWAIGGLLVSKEAHLDPQRWVLVKVGPGYLDLDEYIAEAEMYGEDPEDITQADVDEVNARTILEEIDAYLDAHPLTRP